MSGFEMRSEPYPDPEPLARALEDMALRLRAKTTRVLGEYSHSVVNEYDYPSDEQTWLTETVKFEIRFGR